jgi:hypothetical protein
VGDTFGYFWALNCVFYSDLHIWFRTVKRQDSRIMNNFRNVCIVLGICVLSRDSETELKIQSLWVVTMYGWVNSLDVSKDRSVTETSTFTSRYGMISQKTFICNNNAVRVSSVKYK